MLSGQMPPCPNYPAGLLFWSIRRFSTFFSMGRKTVSCCPCDDHPSFWGGFASPLMSGPTRQRGTIAPTDADHWQTAACHFHAGKSQASISASTSSLLHQLPASRLRRRPKSGAGAGETLASACWPCSTVKNRACHSSSRVAASMTCWSRGFRPVG